MNSKVLIGNLIRLGIAGLILYLIFYVGSKLLFELSLVGVPVKILAVVLVLIFINELYKVYVSVTEEKL